MTEAERIAAGLSEAMPWLISCLTIWMTLLAGNKHKSAWLVGLVNQAFLLVWILLTATWGLLPMNIALWVVYARNHWHWNTEREQGLEVAPVKRVTPKDTAASNGRQLLGRAGGKVLERSNDTRKAEHD